MLRKATAVGALLIIAAAGLYRFAGFRVALDGSGLWPRFVSRGPDYDALEADRARQREQAAAPATAPAQPTAAARLREPPRPADLAVTVAGSPRTADFVRSAERSDADTTTSATAAPASVTSGTDGYWPDFRGPDRDGRYHGPPIRTDWPRTGLPLLWKQPIGLGYASFVVAEGRAFTIEQRRHREVVAAYDIATGRELWTHPWDGEFAETMGGDGPRATPTYSDGRLYALGALGELRCLDARSGALVWRHNILTENGASNLQWGMAASPLIVDDKVIVLPGGAGGRSVAAYSRTTGVPMWTALDDQQAYTAPMLVTIGGVRQLLVVSAERAIGLTVDEGRPLWEYPWVTEAGINVAQPLLLGNNRVFLSAGYGHGAAVFEVSKTGDGFSTRTIWQNTRMKNKFTSSVLREGFIYGLDEAILACIEASTGAVRWKGGRYGYGQVLLAGDQLIVLSEEGELALVRATPDRFTELAKFPALEGKTWNHPVVAGGRLLVRNGEEMAAFDIGRR